MLSRRQLLKTLGLGGAAMASGVGRPAWATSQGPARRLILLSTNHGQAHTGFRMDFGGRPDTELWDARLTDLPEQAFSEVLRPLYRHRDKLVAIDGMSMATAELDVDGYRHEKGQMHAWTGDFAYFTGDALYAGNASLDQLVARHVSRADRLPSLELGVGEDHRQVCHAGAALPLPIETDPSKVFQRMFGVRSDPYKSSSNAMLRYVHGEFEGALKVARGAGRDRLAAHRDLVGDLGDRLRGLQEATCDPGDLASFLGSGSGYEAVMDAQFRNVVAGMACDLVRVATISFGDVPGELLPSMPGSGDAHDSWAHGLYDSETAMRGMTAYNARHAEHMAKLLDLLAATPDPQGGTLLDSTLVVWANELGDGWHGYQRYDAVIAGGGWHFDLGRYLHQPMQSSDIDVLVHRSIDGRGFQRAGRAHQHMLVSVAQAMGLSVDHVGLSEVTAQNGRRVDLTGPLPGLASPLG